MHKIWKFAAPCSDFNLPAKHSELLPPTLAQTPLKRSMSGMGSAAHSGLHILRMTGVSTHRMFTKKGNSNLRLHVYKVCLADEFAA